MNGKKAKQIRRLASKQIIKESGGKSGSENQTGYFTTAKNRRTIVNGDSYHNKVKLLKRLYKKWLKDGQPK